MPCISTGKKDDEGNCFHAESLEVLDVVALPSAGSRDLAVKGPLPALLASTVLDIEFTTLCHRVEGKVQV